MAIKSVGAANDYCLDEAVKSSLPEQLRQLALHVSDARSPLALDTLLVNNLSYSLWTVDFLGGVTMHDHWMCGRSRDFFFVVVCFRKGKLEDE